MMKFWCMVAAVLFAFNVQAAEINAEDLHLTPEQNHKLNELKEKLNAEVQPILEEMESSRNRVMEIEKRYFEEFWKMLTDEQKAAFAKLQ